MSIEPATSYTLLRDAILDLPLYPTLIVALLGTLVGIGLSILGHLRGLHETLADLRDQERWEPTSPTPPLFPGAPHV